MKRKYMTPEMEVYYIQAVNKLLVGSGSVRITSQDWEGGGNAGAPAMFDDEDIEF